MMENNQYAFKITVENLAWIGAFTPLGAMLGCPVTAGLVDKLGRKNMMLMLTIPTIIGWGMIIWAESVSINSFEHRFVMRVVDLVIIITGDVDLYRQTFNWIRHRFIFRYRTPVHFRNSRKRNPWYFGNILPIASYWRYSVHLHRGIICEFELFCYSEYSI